MSEELTVKQHGGLVASGAEWQAIQEQARTLIGSGFFPKSVNTAAKAIAVMLAGRELGLPPMQSIRAVNIVDGKPTLSAETMLALAYQRVPGLVVGVETTPEGATVVGNRPGGKVVSVGFGKAQALAAGLLSKDNWRKYPEAMYRARAISAWCRVVCPDAILGCYTPEEIESVQTAGNGKAEPDSKPEPVTILLPGEDDNPFDGVDGPPHSADAPTVDEPGADDGPPPPDRPRISEAQAKRLWAIAKGKNLGNDTIKSILGHFGYEHTRDVARADYEKVILQVQDFGK